MQHGKTTTIECEDFEGKSEEFATGAFSIAVSEESVSAFLCGTVSMTAFRISDDGSESTTGTWTIQVPASDLVKEEGALVEFVAPESFDQAGEDDADDGIKTALSMRARFVMNDAFKAYYTSGRLITMTSMSASTLPKCWFQDAEAPEQTKALKDSKSRKARQLQPPQTTQNTTFRWDTA